VLLGCGRTFGRFERSLGDWWYTLEDDYRILALSSLSLLLPGHEVSGF
jgi:hypothetical protein